MSLGRFPEGKTCTDFLEHGRTPLPDADVSGLGVIAAYMASAYFTFFLVLTMYFSGLTDGSVLNVVDTHVFHIRPARLHEHRAARGQLGIPLRQVVLFLSDQQIVTGIAIMGAGFQGLRLGGIDSYHYQTVIYLAWMSSSVHLSALSVLAPMLKQRPALKVWRLVGVLVLLVLLIVGLVPTISNDWGSLNWKNEDTDETGWGIPAVCFWGRM